MSVSSTRAIRPKVRGSRHAEYNSRLSILMLKGSSEGKNINQTTASFLVLRTEDIRTYEHS